ncbi:hypothetical protein LX32DRAFT_49520 [Colletotrichum zoysiae]|uniref:Uncharacterized protein n=1 Tax=Colletotrichum zoysiae TaxID=1216348 RepID=A0AAD9HBI2_9PEZI|nr:hypothetical protein LX32DRAFT_49520 [Colletotrichum zoysiae]
MANQASWDGGGGGEGNWTLRKDYLEGSSSTPYLPREITTPAVTISSHSASDSYTHSRRWRDAENKLGQSSLPSSSTMPPATPGWLKTAAQAKLQLVFVVIVLSLTDLVVQNAPVSRI